MTNHLKPMDHDIVIVGAGPGGAAAALKLHQMGMPCVLLDRSKFPRDKVCGDALSGKAITILNRINPKIIERFNENAIQHNIWGIRLVAPNDINLDIPFKWNYNPEEDTVPGYVSPRIDFDNFLISEVKRCASIDFREEINIDEIKKIDGGFRLISVDGKLDITCKLLLDASGAHSSFSRHYAGIKREKKHYAGAVRAYFENVTGLHDDGFIELHFIDEYIPGYFWIFPLPGNRANVGLGLRTDHISKRRLNLKKSLMKIVQQYPGVKYRFENAVLEGKIVGYPLPLGSKKYKISGDHFMLLGDAGHLVDPLTGEGIGNAIYSGWIAAEQAAVCFREQNFSAAFMKDYDIRISRVLGSEMKLSYQLQRLLKYPWLLNIFARRLHKSQKLKDILTRMYSDFELRKQLVSPVFWFKLFTGKDL